MTLGEIIKEYRNKNGASMEYVANLCGITKGYVAMLEKNINSKTGKPVKPTIETIIKVCNGLNLDYDSVFEMLDDDYEITITQPSGCSIIEQKVLAVLHHLTPEAQSKVLEYANDLLASDKYSRKPKHKKAEHLYDISDLGTLMVAESGMKYCQDYEDAKEIAEKIGAEKEDESVVDDVLR